MAKILISLPDALLERVDREARARGSSRSALVRDAVSRELAMPTAERIDAAVARARRAIEGLGAFESSELIRRERRRHDAADRRRR